MFSDLPDIWYTINALCCCGWALMDDPMLLDARVDALEVV